MFSELFQQYSFYSTFKDPFDVSNINGLIVEGIDSVIDELILDLKEVQNEYFSLYRSIMNQNDDLKCKIRKISNYIGDNNLNENSLENLENMSPAKLNSKINEYQKLFLKRLSFYSISINVCLEIFTEIKDKPKTTKNLSIAYQSLLNCHKAFLEDKAQYDTMIKEDKSGPGTNTYFRVLNFLVKRGKVIAKPLNELKRKENEAIVAAQNVSSLRGRRKKAPITARQVKQIQPPTDCKTQAPTTTSTTTSTSVPNSGNVCQLPEKQPEPIITQLADRSVTEEKEQKTSFEAVSNNDATISLTNPQEDSDDDLFKGFEPDAIPLMEAFLQFRDQTRKEKYLKFMQKKSSKAAASNTTSTQQAPAQNLPPLINLTVEQKSLAYALLSEHPPHLMIKKSKVETLITKLGGEVKGAGGSAYSIFWGTKHAVTYEVTHGRDKPGTLTSDYAARVGIALRLGAHLGIFATESIDN